MCIHTYIYIYTHTHIHTHITYRRKPASAASWRLCSVSRKSLMCTRLVTCGSPSTGTSCRTLMTTLIIIIITYNNNNNNNNDNDNSNSSSSSSSNNSNTKTNTMNTSREPSQWGFRKKFRIVRTSNLSVRRSTSGGARGQVS